MSRRAPNFRAAAHLTNPRKRDIASQRRVSDILTSTPTMLEIQRIEAERVRKERAYRAKLRAKIETMSPEERAVHDAKVAKQMALRGERASSIQRTRRLARSEELPDFAVRKPEHGPENPGQSNHSNDVQPGQKESVSK